jgi:hypothetical protein
MKTAEKKGVLNTSAPKSSKTSKTSKPDIEVKTTKISKAPNPLHTGLPTAWFKKAEPEPLPPPKAQVKSLPEGLDARLFAMLGVKRPHDSDAERAWCERYIKPYNPAIYGDRQIAAYVITVGENSKTLFSAHVDTVHRKEGPQVLSYDPILRHIFKEDGEPLGADDGAGVWLLLEMIDAGVPGTYVITRGEECGGIGASWMAQYEPDFLRQFNRAIAFDRKATDSIISHQGGEPCCSDEFALALADALNTLNFNFFYSPDDSGVYTDTKEYIECIPECTNVSVGYQKEHTGSEMLDVGHLMALRDACISLDWESLPTKRDPAEARQFSRSMFDLGYGGYIDLDDPDGFMTREEMVRYARNDPVGFVNELREYLYGEDPPRKTYIG